MNTIRRKQYVGERESKGLDRLKHRVMIVAPRYEVLNLALGFKDGIMNPTLIYSREHVSFRRKIMEKPRNIMKKK